jgi:alpha-amylase
MTKRISLALIVHNHQPVGNFGWVIEDVYEKAYEPMIGALERHPGVRLALHYTGPLLEWMAATRPESIARLRALVARGQIEILGGGLYEPILVALPERDRIGQLERMRTTVAEKFGVRPTGAWLAERVWEPSLPFDLATAGYAYTVLDDNHLRGAFVPEDRMWGTYTTDDQGKLLTIFGTEKGLRYRIPWRPVDELIAYLHDNATDGGERIGIMGDDGEKFGAWPGTYELCWGRDEWVERCFSALEENAGWLSTVTASQWMAGQASIGRIYIPSASYVEMTGWALPVTEQPVFNRLMEHASERNLPELRFLRGAMWRNFQVRYREINELHKQMLRASAAVAAMPDGALRERALDHIYRGQSNDCYWHGWFGGVYIVHMRMATLAELIAAEDLALGSGALAGIADYDLDGVDEVALGTAGQTVVVDIAEGAGIGSWDLRATRVALASVLRRRPEPYHDAIRSPDPLEDADAKHDDDLASSIEYDDHERRSGLVRLRRADSHLVGDFDRGPWEVRRATDRQLVVMRRWDGLAARKTITVDGDRRDGTLIVSVEFVAEREFEGSVELEWNVNLMGGGANPAAYYRSGADEWRHDSRGHVVAGADLSFGNTYEGVEISLVADPPARAQWFAVETVSNSEAGFERVYQGSGLTTRWPFSLQSGQSATFATTLRFRQSRDRSAEESETR